MLSIIIILSIALAIFLGYRTKINTGLFCIVFAYIIGCFVMGLNQNRSSLSGLQTPCLLSCPFRYFIILLLSTELWRKCPAPVICLSHFRIASLCTVCSSCHPFCYGCYLFYGSCIPAPITLVSAMSPEWTN